MKPKRVVETSVKRRNLAQNKTGHVKVTVKCQQELIRTHWDVTS